MHQHAAHLPALSVLVPDWSSANATAQAAHVSSLAVIGAQAQLNSYKSSTTSTPASLLWSQQRQSFAAQVRQCSVLPSWLRQWVQQPDWCISIPRLSSAAAEIALESCAATVKPGAPFNCYTGEMMWHSVQCTVVILFHDGVLGVQLSKHSTVTAKAAPVGAGR